MTIDFAADFIVIGAGSAGATLAGRLSEDKNCKVLLIEAGGHANSRWIDWPIGMFKTIGDSRFDWGFKTEPCSELDNRRVSWPRGKGLGGTSLINGLLYVRGHQKDYDNWESLGNPGWGWDSVRRSFEKSAGGLSAESGGGDGPYHVASQPEDVLATAFVSSSEKYGLRRTDDFNSGDNSGVGYFKMNTKGGRRMSSAKAFLAPRMRQPNLKVLTDCHVKRVIFQGEKAVGVEFVVRDSLQSATARCEVIICAGAIQSPQLLQVSGIGSSDLLKSHAIPVVSHLPGVGSNLQDHLQVRLMFKVRGASTLNDVANSKRRQVLEFLKYMASGKGALGDSIFRAGAFFCSSQAAADWPDVQLHMGLMSFDRADLGPHKFPGITISGCLLRPYSRGAITIQSNDSKVPPKIESGYLNDSRDLGVALEAMNVIQGIASLEPLAGFIHAQHSPSMSLDTTEEKVAWIRQTALSIYHPAGTCAMGPASDPMSVVDDRLRVHGIQSLRVVDASVMPVIVSGNTNGPCVMLGEHAAAMIRHDWAL